MSKRHTSDYNVTVILSVYHLHNSFIYQSIYFILLGSKSRTWTITGMRCPTNELCPQTETWILKSLPECWVYKHVR